MAGVLTQRLRNPRLGLAAATEAISALLQLQADGAHSVQGTDPVALFIASLVGPSSAPLNFSAPNQECG